jgi:transcriptional regulatory protein RtcR
MLLDLFDRGQIASVVKIASRSRTLSEPGRLLFASSREKKDSSNDAARLRKYLARLSLTYETLRARR